MKRTFLYFILFIILFSSCHYPSPTSSPVQATSPSKPTTAPPRYTKKGKIKPKEENSSHITTTPKLTSQIASSPTPSNNPAQSTTNGKSVLYLGIMVHLEGWNDGQDKEKFIQHAALLREYADLFEKYGARLTLESKEFTEGCINWGDNVLLEMEQRGHGIGVHADVGGEKNYNCNLFADELKAKKELLESLGVTVRHVSGIVSSCDWVTAAADAGYKFTTGTVAYGVSSMPIEKRPDPYKNCPGPGACHQPFPPELEDRLHPWRMHNGLDWVTPDPNGRLVILPSGGGLNCLAEESTSSASHTQCQFTQEDINIFIQQLEEAISYSSPDEINIFYVGWSFGTPLDKGILEMWLQSIQPYVKSGQVEWKTLPEMYDAYVQWEQSH